MYTDHGVGTYRGGVGRGGELTNWTLVVLVFVFLFFVLHRGIDCRVLILGRMDGWMGSAWGVRRD